MARKIISYRDAFRHTLERVAVAVSLTVVLTSSLSLISFGTDPNVTLRAGFVTQSIIVIGVFVSAILTAGLSYRSALIMRDLALARAELLRISRTDPLTGLLNRRGFDEAAVSALIKASEMNLSTTVMMCDIDRFKAINDQLGHDFGDKVLVAIAGVLSAFAERNEALVARHGGEEFAVLITDTHREQAIRYAEELRQTCMLEEILSDEISATVTISIGVVICQGATDLPKVMRMADQAMYAAKHRGRNRVVRADVLADSIAAA
jgi:diguanylate cyclase (GGDEF)-like protein